MLLSSSSYDPHDARPARGSDRPWCLPVRMSVQGSFGRYRRTRATNAHLYRSGLASSRAAHRGDLGCAGHLAVPAASGAGEEPTSSSRRLTSLSSATTVRWSRACPRERRRRLPSVAMHRGHRTASTSRTPSSTRVDRPGGSFVAMEIHVARADGTDDRRLTTDGGRDDVSRTGSRLVARRRAHRVVEDRAADDGGLVDAAGRHGPARAGALRREHDAAPVGAGRHAAADGARRHGLVAHRARAARRRRAGRPDARGCGRHRARLVARRLASPSSRPGASRS